MKLIVKDFTVFADAGKRPHNEDFVYPSSLSNPITPNLYIVCDGIGGLGKGDTAAQLSADNIAKFFAEKPSQGPITATYINQALKFVESSFDEYIRQHPDCWGMGATLSVLYFDEFGANIAWAGNCRVYQFRKGNIQFKSLDHTEAAQLLKEGRITETEALTHIRRFPLRAIQGSSYPTQMEFHFIPKHEIEAGDVFYLCSDGVQEAVKDSELATILTHSSDTATMGREIKDLCQISSGDNYASCIVMVEDADATPSLSTPPLVAAAETREVEAPISHNAPSFTVDTEPVLEVVSAEASPTVDLSADLHTETPALTVETPEVHTRSNDIALPSLENTELTHTEEEISTSFSMELPSVEAPSIEPPRAEIRPSLPAVETPRIEVPPIVTPPRTLIVDESVNNTTIGARPTVTPPPPTTSSNTNSILPLIVLGVSALIVMVLGLIWWSGKDKGKSFDQYYEMAQKSATEKSYDKSIAYLDSALLNSGTNADNIRKANLMKNDLLELKRQNDKTKVLAEAAQFASFGKYTDYLQAMRRYKEVIQSYGDNGGLIQKKIDSLTLKMNKIDANKAYAELVAGASQYCTEGNGLEAEMYISEARKLHIPSEKLKELNDLSTKCAAMAQNTTGGTENAVADNGTREVADASTTSTTNAAATNSGANANKTAIAAKGNPSNSSQVVDPNLNKNARISTPNNWEKLPPLEKAKAAFKAKKYDNVLKYFETAKAQNQWDAEAAYMLGYLYHTGLAKEKSAAKALENAKYSASKQNASGLYLYSTMLLNNKKHADSTIAMGRLTEAATLGQKDASALLKQLEAKKKKK